MGDYRVLAHLTAISWYTGRWQLHDKELRMPLCHHNVNSWSHLCLVNKDRLRYSTMMSERRVPGWFVPNRKNCSLISSMKKIVEIQQSIRGLERVAGKSPRE